MNEYTPLLQETEFFQGLTADQVSEVLKIGNIVHFAQGDVIMKEGDIGDTMYVILDGVVEVAKSLIMQGIEEEIEGKNKVFSKLDATRHAVFGEIALLEKSKRTATIIALTNCTFYEFRNRDFLNLTEKDCDLGYRLMLNLARIVSARLRKADEDTIKLTTALSIVLQKR
jgi:CRP/FNR family cyclic AMP-dependent transcriptional regulator